MASILGQSMRSCHQRSRPIISLEMIATAQINHCPCFSFCKACIAYILLWQIWVKSETQLEYVPI